MLVPNVKNSRQGVSEISFIHTVRTDRWTDGPTSTAIAGVEVKN